MSVKYTFLLLPLLLLGGCAGKGENTTPVTPDEVLRDGIEKILAEKIEDPEMSDQLAEIYRKQYEHLQMLASKQHLSRFKEHLADRDIQTADLRDFFVEVDEIRTELLHQSFELEMEKADLLGPKLFKSVIKSEEAVVRDYYQAFVEEEL